MLTRAVTQSGDAVMIDDAVGMLDHVNPAFEQVTGYPLEEAVGPPSRLLDAGRHSPEFYADPWQTIGRGDTYRAVFTRRRRDGHVFFEETATCPIREARRGMPRHVSTAKGVIGRVGAEARLEYVANYGPLQACRS
ncbi:MAG: PAS domain S-box protein [Rhodocyclaceae bacterium]|nr:PAS domain S-box protein [Rhodocyclaceae bacterium]